MHIFLQMIVSVLCITFSTKLKGEELLRSFSQAKTILVTGGAGFLGSHLCERLLSMGNKVICLDNLSTGSLKNIETFLSNPNFFFVLHDMIEPLEIKEALEEIYNLACPASPPLYQEDAIQTLKTNVLGALHVLELARQKNAKVFQASTSEVYGNPLEHPQSESYWGNVNPIGIRSCYDEGKRAAETLFFDYWRQYGVKIKVARIFNTYGPRMRRDDGRVISNFIAQAMNQEPITIYGDGGQTRSFCYVTDMIDAFIAFMEAPDCVIGPINLGNPIEYTILETAQMILHITASSSPLYFQELPSDDPLKRKPDISLARTLLHWEPAISLEEGIKRILFSLKREEYENIPEIFSN